MYLKMHQEQHVTAMLVISQQLESTANQLQEHLRFNHTSLRNAVEHLLVDVEQAQTYLLNEGPTIVNKVRRNTLRLFDYYLCLFNVYLTLLFIYRTSFNYC